MLGSGQDLLSTAAGSTLGDYQQQFQQAVPQQQRNNFVQQSCSTINQPVSSPSSSNAVDLQLLAASLKQSELMMTLILEIRNLKNEVETLKSGSVTTAAPDVQLDIDAERKKKKSIHIPIVLDIEQRAYVSTEKVQQTKMADSPKKSLILKLNSHHGKGEYGKKMSVFSPPAGPPPKKRKDCVTIDGPSSTHQL